MLRPLRLTTALTLRKVATACGISHAQLQAMEQSTSRPLPPEHAAYPVLAELYGVPLEDLQRWASIERKRWATAELLRSAIRDPDIQTSVDLARRVLLCHDSERLRKIAEALDE
jgi:transcriptional regulator with XRE-family HTH domain